MSYAIVLFDALARCTIVLINTCVLFHNFLLAANNELTGTIPPGLGNLTRIRSLFLCESFYCSDVPRAESTRLDATVWQIPFLFCIFLHPIDENELVGPIPSEIGELTRLQILNSGKSFLSNRFSFARTDRNFQNVMVFPCFLSQIYLRSSTTFYLQSIMHWPVPSHWSYAT